MKQMKTFGQLLAAARRSRSLLQKQVAHRAGLDASYLGALERGRRDAPSTATFFRLLEVLEPTRQERERLVHALVVLRLQRVAQDKDVPLKGGEALLQIAQRLPYLAQADLALVESLVQRLARVGAAHEEGIMGP